jgi:hypothetical protein
MTSDEKKRRIRRTRQGIVIASVVGSAGLATALGVSTSALAGDDATQTGTVADQVTQESSEVEADDDYWGDAPSMDSGSGESHAASGGS